MSIAKDVGCCDSKGLWETFRSREFGFVERCTSDDRGEDIYLGLLLFARRAG